MKVSIDEDGNGNAVNAKKAETTLPGVTAREEQRSEGKVAVQVGANANQSMSIEIGDMRAEALGIKTVKGETLSIETAEKANEAITKFDEALNAVSSQRANLGAVQNR